jgi:archaellum component FlaC
LHAGEDECSERIEKLSREKKHLLMSLQKVTEELHCLHDKNGGLVQSKRKLETLVDELESALEAERRQTVTIKMQ